MLIKKKSVAVLCCIVFTALLLPYGRPSSGDAEITEQGEVKPVAPSSQVFNRLSAVYNNMMSTYWDDRNMQGPVYQIKKKEKKKRKKKKGSRSGTPWQPARDGRAEGRHQTVRYAAVDADG